MNKLFTGACILIVCFFSGCASTDQDTEVSSMNSDTVKPVAITPAALNTVNPAILLPDSVRAMTSPLQQPVVNQKALGAAVAGLNPAHGMPGHRCDIAVGAPLNIPATKPGIQTISPTPPTAVQPAASLPQLSTAPKGTPAGMNPVHGAPGHRCDIAVGAPLNSPVTKPATQTTATTTAVQPNVSQPQSSQAKTVTAPGMNPVHGAPGHRCDIAVGAPLSTPVTKPAQTTTPNKVASPAVAPKKVSGS